MAKSTGQVTKIYELKTIGYADLSKQLDNVAKKFDAIRKAKIATEGKIIASSDIADVKKYAEELVGLKLEEQKLRVETQKLTAEQKALNLQRAQEREQLRQQQQGVKAAAGSYAELYKQYRQLYNLVKNTPTGSPVTFNGEILQFDQAIKKLRELAIAEQDFRRQFTRDSLLVGEYTTGIVEAFKRMGLDDLIGGQITKTKQKVDELNTDFDRLQKELKETQAAGKATDSIEKQMIENRNEVIKLDTEVARLRTDLRGTGDVGNQITSSIASGFKNVKGQLSSLIIQYIGFNALINQVQRGVADAALTSDQTTDLELQLGGASEEANKLNDALRKLDTRTTVIGLQQIADIALKAGVTAENIQSVTEAIDKTKIAFGKDFGSIEQGTETFVKLINIFYDDGQITGERILQIGNSVRSLANETVASVPFLTDFSGRMAGLRQIANVSLPDILGLGAGFEEFKQSAEVASTVLVKVIPKLASDTEKYAEIAGMTKESFSALINTNPAEALLRVTEALVKTGSGIEDVSEAFADSELGSGRITSILATLGGNAETFRERIARAGETIKDTDAITDAFNRKNNNLAATIDKLGKKLTDAFSSKSFQTFALAVTTVFTFLITNLPVIIGLLAVLTAGWLAQNSAILLLRGRVLLYNIAIGANVILINTLRVAQAAYNIVLLAFNAILAVVSRGLQLFGISAKAATGPLGIFLALLGLVASAIVGLNKAIAGTADFLSNQNRELRALNEVNQAAAKIYAEQIARIDSWVVVIKSATSSADTKRRAVEELTKINRLFGDVIKDNIVDLVKLEEVYNQVTAAIRAQAKAKASADLTAQRQNEAVQVTTLRQLIEIEAARQEVNPGIGGRNFVSLEKISKADMELVKEIFGLNLSTFIGEGGSIQIPRQGLQKVLDQIKRKEDERIQTFQTYLAVQLQADKELEEFVNVLAEDATGVEVNIAKLRKDIEKLDKEINDFKGSKADLKKKLAERKKLQDELDTLLGTTKGGRSTSYRGAKLTGEQKDDFRDIDAERDQLLAEEERKRLENQTSEEQYLSNIYTINVAALDKKLALLKGANAEERKQIAQFNLEKVKLEFDTNRKIYELRAQALEDQLSIAVGNAKQENQKVQDDPTISPSGKAEAQLKADEAILKAQIEFNRKMDELEKGRNDISKKNAETRANELRAIEEQIRKDRIAIALASVEDERRAGEKLLAEFRLIIAKQRETILKSNKPSGKKDAALAKLDEEEKKGILARELAQLESELPKLKKALEEKAISEEEYAKKYEEYVNKLRALADLLGEDLKKQLKDARNISDLLKYGLVKAFNFDTGTDKGRKQIQLLGETIAQTYDLAKYSMDTYYQLEADNINRNLELGSKKLQQERDQLLQRAESKEEEASINREYQAKQDALDRAAFEKNKKLQREQAKINLAIQLSNLAVVAFGPSPLNIATLGAAGAIMYAVQAAIAIATYAQNIKRINSATYEKGGLVAPTKTGGEIKGPSHKDGGVPFEHKEAEGHELMIINKRSARDRRVRTLTGTNRQIASHINMLGGGVSFAAGARETKFAQGGYLGQSLQPPAFTPNPYGSFGGSTEIMREKLDELITVTESLAEQQAALATAQSERVDRLKVYQVTREVTDAQRRDARQTQIGTLP